MARSNVTAILVGIVVTIFPPGLANSQDASDLAGRWTLNRELSELPRELGFGTDWLSPGASGTDSTSAGGGRGRRGSGGGAPSPFSARGESEDDAKRLQQLTAE